MKREGKVYRKTNETEIKLAFELDGEGAFGYCLGRAFGFTF